MTSIVQHSIRNFRINQMKSHRQPKFGKLGHYLIGEILGEGGFASVYKAQETYTKQQVAAKFMRVSLKSQKMINKINEQVEILRIVDHPNILKIYETIQNQNNFIIITQLIKGRQLFQYICNHGPIQQSLAASIFHQIVLAVKYLHEKGIAHRDIKTQNIMIDSNFKAKLIDFGLATKVNNELLQTICGSPSYIAPELLQNKPYDGKKVDIWCLGIVLYVLLEASLPFDSQTSDQRNQNIKKMRWQTPLISSPEAIQLYRLIFRCSDERISIQGLLNSSFFKKYYLTTKEVEPDKNLKKQVKVVDQIQKLLSLDIQVIKNQIREKKLGVIYSVYNILINKKDISEFQLKRGSRTLELCSNPKGSSGLKQKDRLINQVQKSSIKTQRLQKTHISTPKPKINKQTQPILKNSIKISFEKQIFSDEVLMIEQKGKRRTYKFLVEDKIIGNKIEINKNANTRPRLRDQSPESPKRILDCLRIYK